MCYFDKMCSECLSYLDTIRGGDGGNDADIQERAALRIDTMTVHDELHTNQHEMCGDKGDVRKVPHT